MSALLIRGACAIETEPAVVVRPDTDVLVEDGRIAAVGRALDPRGAEVIDGTDRILLPGFVDTHRHGWQSVLRATAPDDDLGGYLDRIARHACAAMTPADVATAALLTGLECLDAGVTTVQDWAHVAHTPDHVDAVLDGLRSSGVRAVFGYARPVFAEAAPWRVTDVRRVRDLLPGGDSLVTMLLAPAGPSYAPAEEVVADWRLAAELDLRITVHVGAGPVAQDPVATLDRLGVLAEGTLYVHGNSLPDDELARMRDSGGALSITPAVEARMGIGAPMLGRARRLGLPAGLGVDVVTTVPGDLFSVMRAALLSEDASGGARVPVADVLALATAGGAAALGMAGRIGSLRPGAQADLQLLRTDTPGTAGAHDPVALAVSAHPGIVDTVLVGGQVVKHAGVLLHPGVRDAVAAAARIAGKPLSRNLVA